MSTSLPVLNAIQHPLPIYKHCTLQEIISLGLGILLISGISVSLLSFLLLGSGWLGFVMALPLGFGITYLAIGQLAKLKQGKPYGFYQQHCRERLANLGLYYLPYVVRTGRWSV